MRWESVILSLVVAVVVALITSILAYKRYKKEMLWDRKAKAFEDYIMSVVKNQKEMREIYMIAIYEGDNEELRSKENKIIDRYSIDVSKSFIYIPDAIYNIMQENTNQINEVNKKYTNSQHKERREELISLYADLEVKLINAMRKELGYSELAYLSPGVINKDSLGNVIVENNQ